MTRFLINHALAALLLLASIAGTASAKPPRRPSPSATRTAPRSLLPQPKTWPPHGPQTRPSRPVVAQPSKPPATGASRPGSGNQRPINRPPSPPQTPRTPPSMNTDGRRPILIMDENAPRRRPVAAPPRNGGNVAPTVPRPITPARGSGRLTVDENAPRSRPIANPLRVGNGALNPARPSVGQGDGRFGSPRAGARRHNGIDLTAPVGTPVHPVAPGRVIFSGPRGRREGNEVKVYHPDRTTSVYMHLDGQQMPRPGTRVTPGNVIGQVGRSGNVPPRADSHLHLGVFDRNGKPLVPNIQSQPRVLR